MGTFPENREQGDQFGNEEPVDLFERRGGKESFLKCRSRRSFGKVLKQVIILETVEPGDRSFRKVWRHDQFGECGATGSF
jgi:hypothetical protein